MAYPRKIKQKARRLWLEGASFRDLPGLLDKAFPNEKTPKDWQIVYRWAQAEDWNADKKVIEKRVKQKDDEVLTQIADEIAARSQRVVKIEDLLIAHIGNYAQQQPGKAAVFHGKTVDGKDVQFQQLDPKELIQLTTALDKASSRARIETLGYDKLTKLVLPDGTVLTPEDS